MIRNVILHAARTLRIMPNIKTFVFLDMETTGLPFMEGNRTKITELCFVAVEAEHLRLGVFPRVQNKLSFCFNPWRLISSGAEQITGLSNSLLERQSKFSEKTVEAINMFLEHNLQPVCFVAHNGNVFDYPILKNEIERTGRRLLENIFCVDSLMAFKELESSCSSEVVEETVPDTSVPIELSDGFDETLYYAVADIEASVCPSVCPKETKPNATMEYHSENSMERVRYIQIANETTPVKRRNDVVPVEESVKKTKILKTKKRLNSTQSYKLVDVYKRLTSRDPQDSHQAEGDVILMLTCAATFGDKFVDWSNEHAKNFCDIIAMTPGKKIGT